MLIYAVVYFAAPNVEPGRWQYLTPGAVFGVLAWILASAAFFVYVSSFATYSATYGAFATVVVLLVWLYLTNLVLVFGAELNATVDLRAPRTCRTTTTARCCRPRGGRRLKRGDPARAHRGPARAVAAQVAVGRRGDGIAAVEQFGGEAGEVLGQRGRRR